MSAFSFTPKGYGPAWSASIPANGDELRKLNEAIHSASYRWRQQVYAFLEKNISDAVTSRLGKLPPLEELAGRMHRYIAPDGQELITLDHQPLLHVEWNARLGHPHSLGIKLTPMQPTAALPFPIADL